MWCSIPVADAPSPSLSPRWEARSSIVGSLSLSPYNTPRNRKKVTPPTHALSSLKGERDRVRGLLAAGLNLPLSVPNFRRILLHDSANRSEVADALHAVIRCDLGGSFRHDIIRELAERQALGPGDSLNLASAL